MLENIIMLDSNDENENFQKNSQNEKNDEKGEKDSGKKQSTEEKLKSKKEEFKEKLRNGMEGKGPQDEKGKFNFKGLIMLLFIITIFMSLPTFLKDNKNTNLKTVSYSEFSQMIRERRVSVWS